MEATLKIAAQNIGYMIPMFLILTGSVLWWIRSRNKISWILIGSELLSIFLVFVNIIWFFARIEMNVNYTVMNVIQSLITIMNISNSLLFGITFIFLVLKTVPKR